MQPPNELEALLGAIERSFTQWEQELEQWLNPWLNELDQWARYGTDQLDAVIDNFDAEQARPLVCQGCRYYHGRVYQNQRLICALHPAGQDPCRDWENT